MTCFRPCIDLHQGQVKQIVGGSLSDSGAGLRTNFVAAHDAAWFAERYKADGLRGGHVIMLGPGNDAAAQRALAAWPGALQVGGGISAANAPAWVAAGASQVIVTSWLFDGPRFLADRLAALEQAVGAAKLVIDLSCRRRAASQGGGWVVTTNRWQTITDLALSAELFARLSPHCAEFLVHAVDVEGLCEGTDDELIAHLADWCPRPITYAGGGRALADLDRIKAISAGRVDFTFGSALDIFGGTLVRYADCVAWNKAHSTS